MEKNDYGVSDVVSPEELRDILEFLSLQAKAFSPAVERGTIEEMWELVKEIMEGEMVAACDICTDLKCPHRTLKP